MRRWIFGLGLAVLGSSAVAAPPPDGEITPPGWLQRPRAEDLSLVYPKAAAALGLEGEVRLACRVDALGVVDACRVSAEAPAGEGFGGAALRLAPLFRMKPLAVNGGPVDGARIAIPVVFALPKPPARPPVAPAAAAAPPEAGALARRIAAHEGAEARWVGNFTRLAERLESAADDTASPETRKAAADALRAAAEANRPLYVERLANAAAASLSLEELKSLAAFLDSPAGATRKPNPGLAAASAMLGAQRMRLIITTAHAEFCRTRNCDTAAVMRAPVEAEIDAPTWSRTPSFADIAREEPEALRLLGLAGVARLQCRIDALAAPTQCRVVAEGPEGLGVGAAALRLAGGLKLMPALMSAGAEGETVAVTVVLPNEPPDSGFDLAPPRSPHALEAAKAFLRANNAEADQAQTDEAFLSGLSGRLPQTSAGADAIKAIRRGSDESRPVYLAGLAAAYASLFDEDQLTTAAKFRESPVGRQLVADGERLRLASMAADQEIVRRVTADARARFCRDHPCAIERADSGSTSAAMP